MTRSARTPITPPAVVLVVLALLVGAALAGFAAPAGAHEGEGELAVTVVDPADPTGPGPVRYRVLLTYVNDGHPASDATVTLVAEGPTTVGPLPMTDAAEGGYEATVTFPSSGSWTVRFTAVTPAAVLEVAREVSAATPTVAPTVAPPTTVVPTTGPSTAASSATTGVATTAPTATTTTTATTTAGSGDDDGGGTGPWPAILIGLLAGAAIGGGTAVLIRRRRTRS